MNDSVTITGALADLTPGIAPWSVLDGALKGVSDVP